MRGRWTALGLALMLSLTLTSCGVRTGTDTTTGRLSNRGTSGTETPAGRNRNVMEDGSYYAGTDGAVKRRSARAAVSPSGRTAASSWGRTA